MGEEEEINEQLNIYNKYDLSKYKVMPDTLNWKISLDKKYSYEYLKTTAIDNFTISGPTYTRQDKIIAKMTVTPHIMIAFDELIKRLDEKLGRYINEDLDVHTYLEQNPEYGQALIKALQEEVMRYKTKINNIHKAWYKDWKENYGLIEEYQPKLKNLASMNKSAAAQLKSELTKNFKDIYATNGGDINNNPLKYWITKIAFRNLSEIKSIRQEVDDSAYNADSFTQEAVYNQLKQYELEIESMPNNSISAAYYKVDEIMNYIENFTDINHEINFSSSKTLFDRIKELKIYKGYRIGEDTVQRALKNIHLKLKAKLADMTDFVQFLKKVNYPYFKYFNDDDVAAAIFEIYFIRTSNERNSNNWNIRNLMNKYENYRMNPDMDITLNIEDAFTIKKMFKAMGTGLLNAGKRIIPPAVKFLYNN